MVASWLSGLWRLQSDTLGSSPAVAIFSLFSFLSEQVELHLNLCIFMLSFCMVSQHLRKFYPGIFIFGAICVNFVL